MSVETNPVLQADRLAPPLYSATTVTIFSVLFSAIAGGVLVFQNLRDLEQPQAARKALAGSIGYTLLVLWLTSYLPDELSVGNWMGLVVGYVGSLGLTSYFRHLVPDWPRHEAKSQRKPALICLAIFVPLIALLVYVTIEAAP